MTTYTFDAYAITTDSRTDTSIDFKNVEITIETDSPTFSYSINRLFTNDLPEVDVYAPLDSMIVDGIDFTDKEWATLLGQVTWGGGNRTTVLQLYSFDELDGTHYTGYTIELGGARLPEIDSLSDYHTYVKEYTGIPAEGSLAQNTPISWDSIPGIEVDGDESGTGTNGDDLLTGGADADNLAGLAGKDKLKGLGGDDSLDGGAGRDKLVGGGGHDELNGGTGNDRLKGGGGGDTLDGGSGDDFLSGNRGADLFIFRGDFGDDTITDFRTKGKREKMDLSDVDGIESFRDLKNNHLEETADGDAMISDDMGNSITLEGVAIADLSANDFIF
ncbi:hypothetical protein PXK30_05365 [Phaeobacter gallaeciensis]|uniref:calcium-binding protein n=1 Tax=Phaeobacter gallaeciensis TaxID=60890 RepID=UPI00237F7695|nr:hypothetical protein [Phaeobacter gallaeciensis]MDE4302839.1 hypothetical protein [Phaeobacter gallaeciensis]MDE4307068.1 hypothetical protein [Phaeobacter gallaeciensis]MDE4311533.1 hypothetical protein [Phaeobacter gallaeciensis]MDE4316160.1 hypothetical protein [Phaeobacter gallaeciensis]MDE4320460.1 hypothetical protein [Phaeobacter gallaeciensis]